MESADRLRRRISTTQDLRSVVKTMKAFAALSIRNYERATRALSDYARTVELGLQVVLTLSPTGYTSAQRAPRHRLAGIVFGSDQGMCGQLNERVVSHALAAFEKYPAGPGERTVFSVGGRAATWLEDAGVSVAQRFSVPGSADGLSVLVQDLLLAIDEWSGRQRYDRIVLFYNTLTPGGAYRPRSEQVLPLDRDWLDRLQGQPWPSRVLPSFTMDREHLFSSLVRQLLFVAVCRAGAESLASENASRLEAMQNAERNITDRLDELQAAFHETRQAAITSELLDIVAGFETLTSGEERRYL